MKKILKFNLIVVLACIVHVASGQTIRYWVSGGSGIWNNTNNWSATSGGASGATVPNGTGFIAVFNGSSGNPTVSFDNNYSIGQISISGTNIIFNLSTNNNRTISIGNNYSGDDLSINNSNVTLTGRAGADNTLTLSLLSGNTGIVNNSIITQASTDGTNNRRGILNPAIGTLTFDGTSILQHTHNQGSIPTATWQTGSTVSITGIVGNIPSGFDGQVFSNLVWNCPSQNTTDGDITSNITVLGTFNLLSTGSGRFTINSINTGATRTWSINNFIQTGGVLNLARRSTDIGILEVSGTLNQTGGSITRSGGSANSRISFIGSTSQTPTITNFSSGSFEVNNLAGVVLSSPLNISNSLFLTNGVLNMGSNNVTVNNSIQVNAGSLLASTGDLSLISNAASSVTGTLNNIFISGSGGVTFLGNTSVTNDLTIAGQNTTVAPTANLVVGGSVKNTTNNIFGVSGNATIVGSLLISNGSASVPLGGSLLIPNLAIVSGASTGFSSSAGSIIFGSSSIYNHAINGGTLPLATWQNGSTVSFTGITNAFPANAAQSFFNFNYNCTHTGATPSNQNITVTGKLSILNTSGNSLRMFNTGSGGSWVVNDFEQINGTLNFGDGTNQILNIKGNFNQIGGDIISSNSTSGKIRFVGSTNQNFRSNLMGVTNNAFGIEIANTGTVGNNNIILQNNLDLNTNLTFNFVSGNISTGANILVATASGSNITGASNTTGWVIGNLAKNFTTGANISRTFEVGTSTEYAPVTLVNPNVATAGALVVRANAGDLGAISSSIFNSSKSINTHWVVSSLTGATTPLPNNFNITFNYLSGVKDLSIDDSKLILGLFNGSTWNYAQQTSSTANTSLYSSRPGIGSFQIAEVQNNADLYSYKKGPWNDPFTWTEDPSGTLSINPRVPSEFNKATVINGETVTLTQNVTTQGLNLVLNAGGTLDLSTFSITTLAGLSGQGTLRLKSTNLPLVSGSNTFHDAGQGTVDYYNLSTSLPITNTTYNNLYLTKDDNIATNYVYNLGFNLRTNGDLRVRNLNKDNIGSATLSVGDNTTARVLTIMGSLWVGDVANGGGNVVLSVSGFNTQHICNIYGDLRNYGTVDLSNDAQYAAPTQSMKLNFLGSTDNIFFCDGPTEILDMTVNKGTDQTYTLHLSATANNFFKFMTDGNGFPISMGTLRLGNNIVLDRLRTGGNYDIGTGPGTTPNNLNPGCQLWIDGAIIYRASTTGSQAVVPYGKLRITAGAITISGAGIVPRVDGEIFIEGGYINTTKIRTSVVPGVTPRGTFFMSGGVLDLNKPGIPSPEGFGNAGGPAPFTFPFVDASYIMSGGTMNIYGIGSTNANGNALFVLNSSPQNINVTGGTINFSINGTNTTNNISSTAPFFDLNIYKTDPAAGNRLIQLQNQPIDNEFTSTGFNTFIPARSLKVLNKLYIDGVNAPLVSLFGQDLVISKDLEVASGGSLNPTGSNVIFNGSSTQAVMLNGSISGIFGNLNFVNTGASPILLQGSLAMITTNGLNITSGSVNDGGKSIRVLGNATNNGRHFGNGNVELIGNSNIQNITGNGSGIFGNLFLNNTNSSAVGVNLGANTRVRNSLRFISDKIFDIGIYRLTLDSNITASCVVTAIGTGFGPTKFIRTSGNQSDGGVAVYTLLNGVYRFPMGTPTYYSPAFATVSGITNANQRGYLQMSIDDSFLGFLQNPDLTNSLKSYWRVRATNFVSRPNVQYSFSTSAAMWPGGVCGNPNNMRAGRVEIPNRFEMTGNLPSSCDIDIPQHAFAADAYYTAAQNPQWNSSMRVFYNLSTPGVSTINNNSVWSLSCHTCSSTNTDPTKDDILRIANFGATNQNGDAWIDVDVNTTVAGVIFDNSLGGWEPRISINAGISANLGIVSFPQNFNSSATPGAIMVRMTTVTGVPTIAGDFGDFSNQPLAIFNFNLLSNGQVSMPSNITNYPTLRFEGGSLTCAGVNQRIINLPPVDINLTGAMIVGDGATVYTSTAVGGNVNIGLNMRIGQSNNTAGAFYFNGSGNPHTVAVTGNFRVSNACNNTLIAVESGTAGLTHTLKLGGSVFQDDGTIDLFNGNAATDNNVKVEFFGTTSGVYTRVAGNVPELYQIVMNKGNSDASTFQVNSTLNLLGAANTATKPVTFQNGRLVLSTTGVDINLSSGGGTVFIPSTAGLEVVNGSSVFMSSSTGIVLDGLLRIGENGTANFNDGVENTFIEYTSSGNAKLEVLGNASLNVGGQIRRNLFTNAGTLKYTQTGGNVTVGGLNQIATNGKFELDNVGSSISMTGGNVFIQRGGGNSTFGDLYLDPGTSNITGGSFILSPLTTIGNQQYRVINSGSFNNIQFLGVGTSSATGILQVYPLVVNNDLIIGSGGILNANTFGVNSRGNTTINGQYLPTSNTTSFTGAGLQNLVLNVPTNFNNFLVAKSNVLSLTGVNTTINGLLSLLNGTLNDGGLSVFATNNIQNSANHTGTGKLVLSSSLIRFVQGNGSGNFGNIDVNSSTEPVFDNEMTINGNLNFVNRGIYIDDNALNLGLNATISNVTPSKYIRTNGVVSDDGIIKQLPATTFDFTFPVGVFGKYTPVRYVSTSNTATGNIRIIPVNESHPLATDPSDFQLKYYWVASSNGFSGLNINHSYTYVDSDVTGNESLYKAGRNIQGDWAPYYGGFTSSLGGVNPTSNQITLSGLNFINGEYTAGELSELQIVLTYYSRDATLGGNWEDVNSWSTDPILRHAGSISGFTPIGQPIVIKSGHTVVANSNLREAYSTSVSGVIDLGTTFGHNFGIVRGSGTIRIASSPSQQFVLPAGQLASFLNTTIGGTFEFYGSNNGDLPAMNPPDLTRFNNVLMSGSGTKRINSPSPIYNIGGNLSITGGVLENTANNNIIVSKNWINTVGVGGFNPGSSTTNYVEFNGTNQQIVGQNQFRGVRIVNGGIKTFTNNNEIIGQLQLTNGIVDMGNNILSIATSEGSVSGGSSSSFVRGLLQKRFLTGGSVTQNFEVGDAGYSPVSIIFPSVSTQGNVAVRANASAHPQIATSCVSPSKRINRFWTITATSAVLPTNYNATLNYLNPTDIIGGANPNIFIGSIFTGGVWSLTGVGTRTPTSIQTTGLTTYGDIVVGEPKSAVGVTIVGPAMPVCAGTVLNFTALGVNGGTAPGYNWSKIASGVTTPGLGLSQVFSTTSLGSGDLVRVTYTSSEVACLFNNPALSNGIAVSYGASGQWIGAVSNVWTTPGNWCGGIAPLPTSDAIINTAPIYPLINTVTEIRNFSLGAGTSININSPFKISGNFVNDGNFIVAPGNQFQLFGNGPQAISGTSPTNTSNLQIWGTGVKTFNSPVNVSNTLLLGNGSVTVASNGNLTLVSNASGTGRVDVIPAGASITGNVTVQRWIPAKRSTRYFSSPVQGAPISQWQNNIMLTGPGQAANGFDAGSSLSTVLYYDESIAGGLNIGWLPLPTASSILQQGRGYQVSVRGDRSTSGLVTFANFTTTAVTMSLRGTLNQGNITLPITYTKSPSIAGVNLISVDGWNLVGNPYPSQIDWSGAGWTKSNIDDAIYIFDPFTTNTSATGTAGRMYSYVNSVASFPRTNGGVIASSQGFFVKANNTGAGISMTEQVKVASTHTSNFRTASEATDYFHVGLMGNDGTIDYTAIRFSDVATNNYDKEMDAYKLKSFNFNIASQLPEQDEMSVNSMPYPPTTKEMEIPLVMDIRTGTGHKLHFTSMENLGTNIILMLKDKQKNVITPLSSDMVYGFDQNESIKTRFSIVARMAEVVEEEQTTGVDTKSKDAQSIKLYPNPTKEDYIIISTLGIVDEAINYKVTDVVGKVYTTGKLKNGVSESKIDITLLSNGVYLFVYELDGKTKVKTFIVSK